MNAEVFKNKELWLVTGSQHLYGPVALEQVGANSRQVASALDGAEAIPAKVVFKTVATTPEGIRAVCSEANSAAACVGLIFWCHTFSPAKMWIGGLSILNKPFIHLHTQFNQDLPYGTIDMDFMNLNQAAHGDREFGFIHTRMRLERKVVVGHWSDTEVQERIGSWTRAALAWNDWQGARIVRFGDNMRYVAVTCGDKVSAEATFGFSVNTHGIGDLVERMNAVSEGEIDALVDEYQTLYGVVPDLARGGARHDALRYEARLELGIGGFLEDGGYCGYTDTFEDLHGIQQLPGMASQRLMAKGYGFGAEGDWKHSALLRAMKVMSAGLPGGTSFMEDYTYHMNPAQPLVLGAHMLEICPSIANGQPRCEIHPLGIGGKADPVRLVFDAAEGPALNASLVDLGNRFRLVVNEVEAVTPEAMPKLPVARALWKPKPDFKTALASWIYAGGAHHTGYSYSVTTEMLEDFAAMAGIEFVLIDGQTSIRELRKELRSNEVYYHSAKGFSFA